MSSYEHDILIEMKKLNKTMKDISDELSEITHELHRIDVDLDFINKTLVMNDIFAEKEEKPDA